MESSDIYKLVIFYIIILSVFYYKIEKNIHKRKLKKIKIMSSDEIISELKNDFRNINFGIDYKFDITKEEQIKILRYCLLFSNQMIVNCQSEYRKVYLEVIEKLNKELLELK